MKIQKGDTVKVISGKDTGKEGKVLQAFPKKGTVLVEGVNINKKHQKPQGQTMQGGVIDKSMPINVSNVALVVKKHAGRVGYKFDKNGKKYRVLIDRAEDNFFIGRSEFDSPEVDNEVLIEKNSNTYCRIGDYVDVKILKADHFDLYAELIN